jgi:hypothetical protein
MLVTASKDKTLCVWPLNLINELENHHSPEEEKDRMRFMPGVRRSNRLTSTGGTIPSHTDIEVEYARIASELVHIKPSSLFTIDEGFVKSI